MSACYNCMTIEDGICILGRQCAHYNLVDVKTEVRRRLLLKAEYLEKEAARLRKEAEELQNVSY
jgi:hypothetical protein